VHARACSVCACVRSVAVAEWRTRADHAAEPARAGVGATRGVASVPLRCDGKCGLSGQGLIRMESAPFKLTAEMVAVMGGASSEGFEYSRACLAPHRSTCACHGHSYPIALIRTAYCGYSYPTAVIRTQLHSSASCCASLVRAFWTRCGCGSSRPCCAAARLPNTRMAIAARSLLWPPAGTGTLRPSVSTRGYSGQRWR